MSGLFPNALHVARREYLFRVRGRAFLITTLLLAVLVAGFTMLPTFLGRIRRRRAAGDRRRRPGGRPLDGPGRHAPGRAVGGI